MPRVFTARTLEMRALFALGCTGMYAEHHAGLFRGLEDGVVLGLEVAAVLDASRQLAGFEPQPGVLVDVLHRLVDVEHPQQRDAIQTLGVRAAKLVEPQVVRAMDRVLEWAVVKP